MTDTPRNAPDTDVPDPFDVLLREFFRREMPTALRARTVAEGDLPMTPSSARPAEPARLVTSSVRTPSATGGRTGSRAALSVSVAALVLAALAVRWSGTNTPTPDAGHPTVTHGTDAGPGPEARGASTLADRPADATAPHGTELSPTTHPLRAGGAAEGRIVPVGVDPARIDPFDPAAPSAATELPELQIEVHRLTPSRPDAASPPKSPDKPRSTLQR